MTVNIKTLDLNKKHQGYRLTQINRVGNKAIYQVDDGSHFEVIKIRVRKATPSTVRGGFSKEEYYPHSEEWGQYGWTYTNIESAQKRFESIDA